MELLKLAALDDEDLQVISAHVQDAVLKVGDINYLPGEGRFVIVMNRFNWETGKQGDKKTHERRRSVLHFDRVSAVRSIRIKQDAAEAVLELLAVQYTPSDAPAGEVTLVFSGGGAVQLDVECIEAQLSDLGAAWAAKSRPDHESDTAETDAQGSQ